ncbi:hypothetical protein V9T40_005327 [Parthenolecanium corni]|uniref:Uncharacterized protein n=1 Tax=Parthenolecanium corni TaxID=536013 RepID=A0AAN9Y4M9_9HEMI
MLIINPLSGHSIPVIVADPAFVSLNDLKISDIVRTYQELLKGNYSQYTVLSVEFSTSLDIKITKDITTILIIGHCSDVWRMCNNAEDKDMMYLVITENQCKRLPMEEAITIPLQNTGFELPQIIIDLKFSRTISWMSAIIL